jgi:hypothetical protein
MTDKPDWGELVKQAKPRQKSVRLCLRGDLLADLEAAETAAKAPGGSLAGSSVGLQPARDAVAESSVTFLLKGLPRPTYKQLEAAHPDKKDGGWDETTFPEALVRACLTEPVIAADEPLFEILTTGEAEKLFWAAFNACNEADDIPLP